ncbi:uncharacterized protein LOC120546870 isoform X2 [Perca fluviatilis]|uniref:uncharacterized protein LOC120546870 isoform X2 n=1 Tax=Perca fluviatilis TaxID=8168 RepID=UPI001964CD88|nr:uncharacterized protein LOC120546870 isoform X2 [Perca fluviatilis]
MEEFKWIKMSLFLIPLLHFTAAGNHFLSFTVRAGDDVTLPCEYVIDGQRTCNSTTWLFSRSGNTVTLFELGQIKEEARVKSDRLSLRENCSLVIKKVTEEDAGPYTCRQFRSGQHQGPDTMVVLSVTMTEQKNTEEIPGGDTKPTTTATTATPESTLTTESSIKSGWWWWTIAVFVAVAALLIITVAVIRWKRAKGNKTLTYENTVRYDVDDDTVIYENLRSPDPHCCCCQRLC